VTGPLITVRVYGVGKHALTKRGKEVGSRQIGGVEGLFVSEERGSDVALVLSQE